MFLCSVFVYSQSLMFVDMCLHTYTHLDLVVVVLRVCYMCIRVCFFDKISEHIHA